VSEIKPGDRLLLEIESLNHAGEGVARRQGRVIFVPRAVPGDRVRAAVTEVKKNYLRAGLEEVLAAGPARTAARCPAFERCGGCHIQHLDYESQLRYKTGLVRDSLERIGGLKDIEVLPMLGMGNPWHYRNKVRLHVERREDGVVLGFFAPGSHLLGSDFGEGFICYLVDEELNRLARAVRAWLNEYRECPGGGDVREITLRRAAGTGETMVVLTTAGECPAALYNRVGELAAAGVTAVVRQSIGRGGVSEGKTEVLCGPGFLTDRLDDLYFRLSAASFYQVNPVQTGVLYRKVLECAALSGGELVMDAYCGVGTIALYLARRAGSVLGLELFPAAVADAAANARLNRINNAAFMQGAVEEVLPRLFERGRRPDVVVLDPPRRGCHRRVLQALAARPVKRVIYVSCDPGTLARDLGFLAGHGYRPVRVQPVDMFPQTRHVECVVLMQNVKNK